MTNFVVNPDMDLHVEYGTSEIESYRTVTHDVIKIYGFRFKNNENGQIKAIFRIEDGLRKRVALCLLNDTILESRIIFSITLNEFQKHLWSKWLGSTATMHKYKKILRWYRRTKSHSNMLNRTRKQRRIIERSVTWSVWITNMSLPKYWFIFGSRATVGCSTSSTAWCFEINIQGWYFHQICYQPQRFNNTNFC